MIVRVTTLGAADGDAAGAATAVVKYLDGRAPAPGGSTPGPLPDLPPSDGTKGIVGYYADSVEGPGRWLGRGITGMRLEGQVEPEQFRRVLLGQHALTGEQLVGPNGSAVRADRAGRQKAQVSRHGEADDVLTLAQAATLLGVSDRYLRRLADETRNLRAGQAKAASAGQTPADTPTTFLDAGHDGGGKRWTVTRAEVERFATARKPPAAVVGFDLTFSVPKSVSILWDRADRAILAQSSPPSTRRSPPAWPTSKNTQPGSAGARPDGPGCRGRGLRRRHVGVDGSLLGRPGGLGRSLASGQGVEPELVGELVDLRRALAHRRWRQASPCRQRRRPRRDVLGMYRLDQSHSQLEPTQGARRRDQLIGRLQGFTAVAP